MNKPGKETESDTMSFLAIPLDALKSTLENGTNFVRFQNLIIKTLPTGELCMFDATEFLGQNFDNDVTQILFTENEPARTTSDDGTSLMKVPVEKVPIETDTRKEVLSQEDLKKKVMLSCVLCKESFENASAYRKHMMWHKNNKKYKCEQCSAGFNVESNLKLHLAVHDEKKLTCPLCQIDFQRIASLKSHLLLHQVDEMFTCDECMAEFDKEDELLRHKQNHLKKVQDPDSMVCTTCKTPTKFTDPAEFKEHLAFHVKVKKLKKVAMKGKKSRRTHSSREYHHVCKTCNKSFPKVSLLERHERIHSGEKPFVCDVCSKRFTQKCTLQIHLSKHAGVKPFECTLCPAKFTQKGNLRVHVEKTHMESLPGEKTYKCPQCMCMFKKLASLNGHMTKRHAHRSDDINSIMEQLKALKEQITVPPPKPSPPPAIPTIVPQQEIPEDIEAPPPPNDAPNIDNDKNEANCTYVKLTETGVDGNLRRYLVKQQKSGDVSLYICNYCSKDFKKPSDLIRHIRVHTRERPYKCAQCGSAFSLKSTLLSHLNTHRAVKEHKCNMCCKFFSSLRTLNAHLRKHEKYPHTKPQQYKCKICGKIFKTLEAAKNHKQEHKNEETKNMELEFSMKQPLLQTDVGLMPVAIPRSKMPFVQEGQKDLRPHRCTTCSAGFKKSVHLRRHMLTHTGARNYTCSTCNKSFFTGSSLREHMKFHARIKNHACKFCDKRFVTLSLLKRHIMTHSTSKPFVCPYCSKRFKSVVLCRKHIKIHKKDFHLQICTSESTETENLDQTNVPQTIQISQPISQPISTEINTSENIVIPQSQRRKQSFLVRKEDKVGSGGGVINILQDKIICAPTEDNNGTQIQKLIPDPGLQEQPQLDNAPRTLDITDANNLTLQRILVNTEDLQLTNSVNLHTIYPQLKIQNTDPPLLNPLTDLQDSNILFNIDNLESDLESQNVEIFNTNQIFTSQLTDSTESTMLSSIEELTTKQPAKNCLIKIQTQKDTEQLTPQDNVLINGLNLYPNVTFTNQNEPELQINSLTNSTDALTQTLNINEDTVMNSGSDNVYYFCTSCLEVFLSLGSFRDHDCVVKNQAATTSDVTEKAATADVSNVNNVDKVPQNDVPSTQTEGVKCTIASCEEVFTDLISLTKHMKVDHNKMKHVCSYCAKGFQKPSDLNRHLRTHTGERPFACTKCDKKFSLKSTLDYHYRVHDPNANKQYKCEVCNAYFTTKATLKVHLYIHTGRKPYQCKYCSMKFRTLANKKLHETTKHDASNPTKKPAKPKIMDILLASVSQDNKEDQRVESPQQNSILRDNTFLESQDAAYGNTITELQLGDLTQETSLVSDMNEATRPQTTEELQTNILLPEGVMIDSSQDNILLLDESTLINIRNIQNLNDNVTETDMDNFSLNLTNIPREKQEKERIHECPICQKKYTTKVILRKHLKTHGENRKFPCTKCNKGFDEKTELDTHLKTHLGFRPYSCTYCSNSFSEEPNLKSHMKRLHGQTIPNIFSWDQVDFIM